ncbi:AMIN-like domain-containing (lipo)protein [Trueperella pecoris]|uniref:AMIN-like domain-containing protein n=1 Tax=Trueperella pecoris TaxID=2733571 RepID=A0A7M1QST1_9ACTO|nr:hypothetical protein [Trueperella pecoris]QOR44916.1 hypothetical protein INS88_06335 [Trueperella pecoris]
MKRHFIAMAALLPLAACTNLPTAQTESTPVATPMTTITAAPTAPATTDTPMPTAQTLPAEDRAYTAADQPSQSAGWPAMSAQALPYAVEYEKDSIAVIYSWDGAGEMNWYTDGWADRAYEDGSGFPIDVHSDNVLQIWVNGIRYPEGQEVGVSAFTLSDTKTPGVTRIKVSAPFEGQHSLAIGGLARVPYRIETSTRPTAEGSEAVLKVSFKQAD